MTIEFNCDGCHYPFRVPDSLGGKQGRCPKCGVINNIPLPPVASPIAVEPLPPPRPAPALDARYDDPNRDDWGRDDYDDRAPRGRKRKSKKGLILGLVIGAAALLLIGGGLAVYFIWFAKPGLGEDAKYLPSSSKLIMSIKVEELLSSKVWKDLKKEFPMLEDGEKMANSNSPIDLSDIERVLVGGDPGRDEFVAVFRLKKAVKAADFENKIPGNFTFKDKKIGKYTMRVPEDESADMAYCQVDPKLVVMGSPKALKGVLERDKKPQFSTVMENAIKDTDFSATLAMALDTKAMGGQAQGFAPPPPKPVKAGGPGNFWDDFERVFRAGAGGMNPFGAMGVDGMGMSLKVSSDIGFKMTMVCKDSSTAASMRDSGQKGLREAKKGGGMMPAEIKEIVNTASIGGRGVNVTFSATVKLSSALSLAKQAKAMFPGGF